MRFCCFKIREIIRWVADVIPDVMFSRLVGIHRDVTSMHEVVTTPSLILLERT